MLKKCFNNIYDVMIKEINNYILYYNSDIVNNIRTLPYGLHHLLLYTTYYCFIYISIHILFKNIFLLYLGIFILFIIIIFINAYMSVLKSIVVEIGSNIIVDYLMNTTVKDILNRYEDLIF